MSTPTMSTPFPKTTNNELFTNKISNTNTNTKKNSTNDRINPSISAESRTPIITPISPPPTTKDNSFNNDNDKNSNKNSNILAPFNPTNNQAQCLSLELLSLREDDVLFDLGCGDARILIAAAVQTPGLRCVGIEIDPRYYRKAIDSIASYRRHADDGGEGGDDEGEGVVEGGSDAIEHRIHIHLGDALLLDTEQHEQHEHDPRTQDSNTTQTPISQLSTVRHATCVFLYLLPEGLEKVTPLLERCIARDAGRNRAEEGMGDATGGGAERKFRVVSYMFRIPGWNPVAVREHAGGCCKVYLYDATSL